MNTLFKILLLIGLLSFTASAVLAESSVNEELTAEIYSALKLDTAVYTVEILSGGFTEQDISGAKIKIKPLYNNAPLGRFAITASLVKNGTTIESKQVRLFIHKYANVVAANDRISRFDELNEKSITIERRDITNLKEQSLVSIDEIKGNRARRNLAKGTVLTTGDVELIPLIKSHTDIHIIYASGLCRVTSQGQALQDGQIGDFIKVKNKSSGKIVFARIVDDKTAAVAP